MAKKTDTVSELDVPVTFGGFRMNDETAAIGISIPSDKVTLTSMDHYFRGSRCEVSIKVDPEASDDVPGQETFDDIDGDAMVTVADFPSFRASAKKFGGISIIFSAAELSDTDITTLSHMAKKSGRLKARRVGDIERKSKDAA